jgi:hypothetical protein
MKRYRFNFKKISISNIIEIFAKKYNKKNKNLELIEIMFEESIIVKLIILSMCYFSIAT